MLALGVADVVNVDDTEYDELLTKLSVKDGVVLGESEAETDGLENVALCEAEKVNEAE